MPNVYSRLSVSSLFYMLLSYTGVLGLVDCGQIRGTGMGRTACGAKRMYVCMYAHTYIHVI